MSEQCKGQWHDYPNCEGCPMLGDSCDGSDEYNNSLFECPNCGLSDYIIENGANVKACNSCGWMESDL